MDKEFVARIHVDCPPNREATTAALLGEAGALKISTEHPSGKFSVVYAEIAFRNLEAVRASSLNPVFDGIAKYECV